MIFSNLQIKMKKTFKFYTAMFLAKCANKSLKLLRRNASYFPGNLALKICPNFLEQIDKPPVIIGVTGTNGKTTTNRYWYTWKNERHVY